jgi:hypothetical protein
MAVVVVLVLQEMVRELVLAAVAEAQALMLALVQGSQV